MGIVIYIIHIPIVSLIVSLKFIITVIIIIIIVIVIIIIINFDIIIIIYYLSFISRLKDLFQMVRISWIARCNTQV